MERRWRYLLIGSLVANVFLIGAAAGFLLSGAAFGHAAPARHSMFNLWAVAKELPPADRRNFRKMLRQRAATLQPQLQGVRSARRRAVDLIAAPQYDAKAVADALAEARNGEVQVRAGIDSAFVAYLAGVPASERAAISADMIRAGRRPPRQPSGDSADDGPPHPR